MEVKPREQNKGLTEVAPTAEYGHLDLQHICCQLIRTATTPPPQPRRYLGTPLLNFSLIILEAPLMSVSVSS